MNISIICALAALCLAGPAVAANKCTGSDGKITFQDAPCPGVGERLDIKPASGRGIAPAPSGPASKPGSETQRLEGIIADSQRNRRRQDLRDSVLPIAETALNDHRKKCEQRQATLSSSQYAYQQNLYGKVHAAQIASEMAAEAATCDRRDRELKDTVDLLVKECAELKCR